MQIQEVLERRSEVGTTSISFDAEKLEFAISNEKGGVLGRARLSLSYLGDIVLDRIDIYPSKEKRVRIGKSWGEMLMKEVNNYVIKNDKKGVLFVSPSNQKALDLYLKAGWSIVNKESADRARRQGEVVNYEMNFNSVDTVVRPA